jgi:hypothetical protein
MAFWCPPSGPLSRSGIHDVDEDLVLFVLIEIIVVVGFGTFSVLAAAGGIDRKLLENDLVDRDESMRRIYKIIGFGRNLYRMRMGRPWRAPESRGWGATRTGCIGWLRGRGWRVCRWCMA